ncbi:MAG: tRNA pseudouridine(13) synthase TruD, partial [Pseudomonadales bacterium]|nr:tRNA pseudouridine(13) synthase TruD [Pseudomonadales bacterium]
TGLENIEVLSQIRHVKKLRRGELSGNLFVIRLTNIRADFALIEQRLQHLSECGFPNYFGEQRFGEDNLKHALAWIEVRRNRRTPRFKKALYISVLRAFLYNQILAMRIEAQNWNQLVAGDIEERGAPTGTLWGRGKCKKEAESWKIEQDAVGEFHDLLNNLEHVGLMKEQRRLVEHPENLKWEFEDNTLCLSFGLPKGVFATSMLREIVQVSDVNPFAAVHSGLNG